MSNLRENLEIPGNWTWKNLGEICEDSQYGWTTSASETGDLHLLRTTDITSGRVDWDTVPYCEGNPDNPDKYLLEPGDIVISRAGSVGFSYLVENPREAVFASYLIRFKPHFAGRYIAYFLKSPMYWRSISESKSGVAVQNVNATKLSNVDIPIAPPGERNRVVAKIDELFSNLDAGIEDLQTAKQQLEHYRKSVLQAAVEGRLTADWRRTHDPEPAAQLLERAEEKETVNKYKNRGKLTEPDADLMYEIPPTWEWIQIGDLARAIRYGTSDKAKKGNKGVPMLRMGDIEGGELHYDDLKYLPEDWEDKEKFLLRDGDVLFNRTNSAELVGKTAVYKDSHPETVFASYLVRARLYLDVYTPDLMAYYINSVQGRKYINSVVSQQVGQANVNATKMASMPIPLPPFAEQKQIVDEVERLLSVADDAAATAEREHTRAERLRQSILKKAFSGQLVPHEDGAPPPSLDGTASEESDTGSSKDADSDVENLMGSADPSKQIEMDL